MTSCAFALIFQICFLNHPQASHEKNPKVWKFKVSFSAGKLFDSQRLHRVQS
jgi:hypothetical protein